MRLIDADATIADLLTVDPQYETMIDWCCRVLEAQPTVDAEPVIRCRDCKYAKKIYIKNLPWLKQWEYSCVYSVSQVVMGDGFCSQAEPKEISDE